MLKHRCSDFFADDMTVHTSSQYIDIINTELQTDLEIINSWSKQSKMKIHCIKTTYMLVRPRGRLNDFHHLSLNIDDKTIKKFQNKNF